MGILGIILAKFANCCKFFIDVRLQDAELHRLCTYTIAVACDPLDLLRAKWGLFDLENDLKRLNSVWHPLAPFCASYE